MTPTDAQQYPHLTVTRILCQVKNCVLLPRVERDNSEPSEATEHSKPLSYQYYMDNFTYVYPYLL